MVGVRTAPAVFLIDMLSWSKQGALSRRDSFITTFHSMNCMPLLEILKNPYAMLCTPLTSKPLCFLLLTNNIFCIFIYKNKKCLNICVSLNYVDMCVFVSTAAYLVQKKPSDTLELKIHVVVSCLRWVLGTKLRSSGRAESTLSC